MSEPKPQSTRLYLKSMQSLYEKLSPVGLVPPQAVDQEESMLGAMMIDRSSSNRVISIIGDRSFDNSPFYRECNTYVYLSMLSLSNRNEPIDLLTVKSQLVTDGKLEAIGGPAYLVDLTSKVVTTVNVESYARIILEMYMKRELIRVCEEMKLRAFEGELDTFNLLEEATDGLLKLSAGKNAKSRPRKANEVVTSVLKTIERASGGEPPGVAFGFTEIDRLTQGMGKGSQIVLAGGTSDGKSALACYMGLQVAKRGEGVVIFSSEMKDVEIYYRFLAAQTGISQSAIRSGFRWHDEQRKDWEWKEIGKEMMEIGSYPLWIDDTPGLTPLQIRGRLKQITARYPVSLVIVDYLQLLRPSKHEQSREREVSSISSDLRILWSESDVAGLVLSQLNRPEVSYDREGKPKQMPRPVLTRLRESGAIEQDAHDVYFIYHPDGHEVGYDDRDIVNIELIRAKARAGRRGTFQLRFDRPHLRYEEIQSIVPPQEETREAF